MRPGRFGPSGAVARALTFAYLGSLVLAAYATIHQYNFSVTDHPGTYFVWQNLGRDMMFVAVVVLVVLHQVQRGVYGWAPKPELTEHQSRARLALFAHSYRVALVTVVLFCGAAFWNEAWIARVISQPTNVYPGPFDLHWLLLDLVLLVGDLPSLIGAWRRDVGADRTVREGTRAGGASAPAVR